MFVVIGTFKPGINLSSAEHEESFQTADTDLILLSLLRVEKSDASPAKAE